MLCLPLLLLLFVLHNRVASKSVAMCMPMCMASPAVPVMWRGVLLQGLQHAAKARVRVMVVGVLLL